MRWRSISLLENNGGAESFPEQYRAGIVATHRMLRVVEQLRAQGRSDLIERFYTEVGTQIHHDDVAAEDVDVAAVLSALGADTSLVATLDDERLDDAIRASMSEALSRTGDDVGTPLVGIDGNVYLGAEARPPGHRHGPPRAAGHDRPAEVSRRLNSDCDHHRGDMRTVRLGRVFASVFVHDAVDHMTTEADLRQVIETAFVHCRPGGVAVFVPDHIAETFAASSDHGGGDGAGGRGVRYPETYRQLADLAPRTLAVMHGSSFSGDCPALLRALAGIYEERAGSGSAPASAQPLPGHWPAAASPATATIPGFWDGAQPAAP